jgi:alpha-glucosidase
MNEPAVFDRPDKTMPDDVQHRIDEPGFGKRTASHLEIHNIFGMQNSRATYEGQLALRPNDRPFVMTRASYAGGQRYSTTWTGDNSSTWNHLRMTVPQLVNLGLSGFSLAGADVGGFAGSPPPDLLTKWVELSAFQPMDRNRRTSGDALSTSDIVLCRISIPPRRRLRTMAYLSIGLSFWSSRMQPRMAARTT